MSSLLDIANSALAKIGLSAIPSLDADTSPARACKSRAQKCVDYLLSTHRWQFALARSQLTPLSQGPSFGFTYQFPLPSDLISIVGIYDTGGYLLDEYSVESGNILANVASVRVIYIARPQAYPEYFAEAAALYLANDLSYQFNPKERDSLFVRYERQFRQARSIDSRVNGAGLQDTGDSKFLQSASSTV